MTDQRNGSIFTALATIAAVCTILFVATNNSKGLPALQVNEGSRALKALPLSHFRDPKSSTPRSPPFAYLIINYHKTGHALSKNFLEILKHSSVGLKKKEKPEGFRPWECQEQDLPPGTIDIQAGPDFFCEPNVLAESLLQNSDTHNEKKGVKIIHLVRNPFTMALSNWKYHSQYPTPEKWVYTVDPCHLAGIDKHAVPLVLGGEPITIMKPDDIDASINLCKNLYQNEERTKKWNYYDHLRNLEPKDALSLATVFLLKQQMAMAFNLIKLKQVQQLGGHELAMLHLDTPENQGQTIQVTTLSMDDFVKEPGATTFRFLDFALGDSVTTDTKERMAANNERKYNNMMGKAVQHITHGKGHDDHDKELEMYLREHEIFGRVLGNIEGLVNELLMESYNNNNSPATVE